MASLSIEQQRFFKSVDVASGCLQLGLTVAMRRSFLGKPKPTTSQLAYCYGFAETIADNNLGVDNFERAVFVRLVFDNLFGKGSGSKLANKVVDQEIKYESSLARGIEHAKKFLRGEIRGFQAPWRDVED